MIPLPAAAGAEPTEWRFRVHGRPMPQGSMRERVVRRRKVGQRTRFIVHDQSNRLYVWRENVAASARKSGVGSSHAPPVIMAYAVSLTFFLVHDRPVLTRPTYKHDLDKLVRAVLDALKGIAWADDGQVVRFDEVEKRWASADCPPGVAVTIRRLPP